MAMSWARAASRHSDRLVSRGRRSRGVGGVEVLGQVRSAHDEAGNPAVGAGHLLGVEHAERGLHHAPYGEVVRRPICVQQGHRLFDHVGIADLGQQHRVRPAGRRRRQIIAAPRRGQAVDPDDQLAAAVAALGQGRHHLVAGLVLGVGADRILQVHG